MTGSETIRLLLDEMFAPSISRALRELGHDVIAVVERPDLRALPDDEIFARAIADRRWIVTENVKDFRPILLHARAAGSPIAGLIFTSGRTFPRSRRNIEPIVNALHQWLTDGPPAPPTYECWLQPAR